MDSKMMLPRCYFLMLFAWVAVGGAPPKVFNVKKFGAVADGKTDCSKALLEAWEEACAWDGVGRVLIPNGTYLVGPVVLKGPCKGPTVVQVQGVVKAPGLDQFDGSNTWINFQYIDGLTLTGGGIFDGQGAEAWPHNHCAKNSGCELLPTSLRFSFINNATVRRISSVDSKFFHIIIFECKNMKLQGLNISAPDESPNTDGIHIGDSDGVTISRSVIGTGDDCISMGPGSRNISISNVFCGPGHGISVGSLGRYDNEEDVADIFVRNCTFSGTTNGLRIKTWENSPLATSASNFTYENIVMNNVSNPIIIDQQYCPRKNCNRETPSRVKISNVRFRNVRGTSRSKVAVTLLCSKNWPCKDVELQDIHLEYKGREEGDATSSCSNVKVDTSGQQMPPCCL